MPKVIRFFLLISILSSCSQVNNPSTVIKQEVENIKNNIGQRVTAINKAGITFSRNPADKSKPGSISVILDFAKNFKTKGNVDGIAPKDIGDITHAILYLTTSDADPLATAELMYTSAVLDFTGSPETYVFSNIPTGGPYFVAVELFDNEAALTANNLIEPVNYNGTTGSRGISVSSNSVSVDGDNLVSSPDPLTISPVLKAGTGASLEAIITPVNGTYSGIVGAI